MSFNAKFYYKNKLKNKLLTNTLIFFSNKKDLNFKNLFKFFKINNKITSKIIENSTKKHFLPLINCSFFLIETNNYINIAKFFMSSNIFSIFLIIFGIKINNKLFYFFYLQKSHSLNYFQNKKLIIQFCLTKLKQCVHLKISKKCDSNT